MEQGRESHICFPRRIPVLLLLVICLGFAARMEARADAEGDVFTHLMDTLEVNPAAVCGIMGNIKAESNFSAAISGYGAGYGLCQWTGGRTSRLHTYCSSRGLDSSSIKGQVSFIGYELQNYYPQVYSYLRSVPNTAQGAFDAGYYWCMHYEIPANRYSASAYRASLAKTRYWPLYGAAFPYLTAVSSKTGIKLSWNADSSAVYAVKRAETYDGTYKTIATCRDGKGTCTDTTARKQRRYYYYVAAVSGKKEILRSNRVGSTHNRTLNDENCTITFSQKSLPYTGSAVIPKITVKYDGEKLKEGTDYKAAFSDSVNVGKVRVTFQGAGRYTGKVTKSYRITKGKAVLKAKDCTVEYKKGASVTPQVRLKGCAEGTWKLISRNKKILRVSGQELIVRGAGRCKVKVRLTGTANYTADPVVFTVMVLPPQVRIDRVYKKGGRFKVTWDNVKKCSGYQIQYSSGKFTEESPVLEVSGKSSHQVFIPAQFVPGQFTQTGTSTDASDVQAQPAASDSSQLSAVDSSQTAAADAVQTEGAAGQDLSVPTQEVRYLRIRSYIRLKNGDYLYSDWSRRVKAASP